MLSAIESTIDMMKDVELEEERAKQAKVEAFKAGEDILSKVEELREILKHSKEANDMVCVSNSTGSIFLVFTNRKM